MSLEPGEVMASYYVKALFTSVPMDSSIAIVQCKLQQDPLLPKRTYMSNPPNSYPAGVYLKSTYFIF